MLKPERVTFSADDDNFHQFANRDQLDSFLNDSLVHYSTNFKTTDQQELTSLKHSNSLNELSSITMSSQQQTEHEPPPASAPPSLISEQIPILTENNLHQFDALTLQQLAIGSNQTLSNINEEDTKTSPSHSTSLVDIQKEIDRVKQMKYGRTYSSPSSSSLCSRLTINPYNGSNNNIDLSSITHSVHFTEQQNQTNHLPFSSTYITSIPESIVPPSGSPSTNDNHFIPIDHIESPSLEDREVFETFHTKQTSIPGVAIRQSIDPLNRNITSSETDLIASLHRSASKQALDNQSDHGTTYSGTSDDMIFVEWDKERSLFQDYINSLRTEIRVLLQERLEYQKQMETINNNLSEHKHFNLVQINTDQTKFDLLQKSLEEKNLVLEQLQKEYETVKEKNINLTRKISNLRCDAKSQTGVIDELKQKIAELTVDIQNHILVKRRLEISMMNLESDCKIIDAERIRLNHDIKDTQLSKQDLEKLLQRANVQIAEQGTTIEMLRSDNIQIRSQLSGTQRRMLQEKQQVMDYLRQIENDLIEKEQIKQRESILRKDFDKLQLIHKKDRQEIDQLNLQINQDQQKLTQLEQERLQLLKTIQNFDDKQVQLETEIDSYKSATKRLYTHFKIPFDTIQSIDQLIPMLEDRYRTEQISHARVHHIPLVQSTPEVNNQQETEEIRQLRDDFTSMNRQLKQLDEANQAWQQYQQNQLILLRDRLKLTDIDNLSFEDIVQQIENRFNDLNNQLIELQDVKKIDVDIDRLQQHSNELQDVNTQTEDNEEYQHQQEIPSHYEEELRHLREDLAALTTQCAQLDEANRSWQQYHQTQLDNFRNKLQNSLSIENSLSLDDISQHILAHLDQAQSEHENLMHRLQTSEKLNNDLRSELTNDNQTVQQTYVNTINELNQQLQLLKQQNDQLETEKYILNQQLEKQSSISFKQERNTPTPDSTSSDSRLTKKHTHPTQFHEAQIHNVTPVQSASPLTNEHEQELQQLRESVALLTNQCAQLDQANHAWQQYQQSQLDNFRDKFQDYLPINENLSLEQTAQQIVDQITKERQDFTEQYRTLERSNDDLRSESAINLETIKESYVNTINELNQELLAMKEKNEQIDELRSSNLLTQTFDEVPVTSSGSDDQEEIRQLRENLVSLTTQLDETNRAWQQYQQTQLDILRNQLENYLSIDYNGSFDDIAQQIVEQVTKEREDFSGKYQALEKANNDLRSESSDNMESIRQSYTNTVNELNQELLAMKEAYDQLDTEKQVLMDELEKRPIEVDQEQTRQTIEKVPSSIWKQPFKEVPIHASGANIQQDTDEVKQLRESVALLTTQCAQLDEANRAWQQYQQTQLNNFQIKLHDYLPINENASFNEIAQQIVDHLTEEREDFSEKYQALEKANNDLRSESNDNMESIRQSHLNTVNELNQELLAMKEAYDQLDTEKQGLISELEKRSIEVKQEQIRQTFGKVPSDLFKQPFAEVPIHTTGTSIEQNAEELRQLRENVALLTTQCAQLDEANGAWQQYQQTQSDNFRNKFVDYFFIDENTPFDQIAQGIIDQIAREREDFTERYQVVEKANDDLRSESTNNLETIKQSYMNTVDELNQELLAMKEAYEQLDTEKQVLMDELEKRPIEVDQEQTRQTIEIVPSSIWKRPFKEVPIHTSGDNGEQDAEELQQLRENVALLTTQCAQLDEANRAWLLYQQAQLDNFRKKFLDCVPIDETLTLDQAAQQIVDEIIKEREDFTERYQTLEKVNDDLRSESAIDLETIEQSYKNTINQLNQEFLTMKEAYDQLDTEKQSLIDELEKRPLALDQEQDKQIIESSPINLSHEVPVHTIDANVEQEREELQQLRENFAVLTSQYAQLNEANQAWQDFHQSQLENFREKVEDCLQIDDDFSFDQIAQQIVDQITKEREDFTERYQTLEKTNNDLQSDSIQDKKAILLLKEQYEKIVQEKEMLINEIENQPIINNHEQDTQTIESTNSNLLEEPTEISQLRENLVSLTAQLDETNRSWKRFYDNQIDLLKNKFKDYIHFDNNLNFDQIIQLIFTQLEQQNQEKNDLFMNNNQNLRHQFERSSSPFISQENFKQNRQTPVQEVQIHTIPPVQSSSSFPKPEDEEFQQLRTNLSTLTAQCTQLDEANRAWQQYHQNQLDIFRNKLQNSILLDDNLTLEQIAQQIVIQLDQTDSSLTIESLNKQLINYQLNESILAKNLEELNQKLLNAFQECEEFREHNAKLVLSQQQIEQQLEERQQQINDLQSNSEQLFHLQQHNDLLQSGNQQLQFKLNDMEQRSSPLAVQRVDSPRENVAIHNLGREEEIRQLRKDLAAASTHCLQLEEANRAWQKYQYDQIESFTKKLQEQIPSFNQIENLSLDLIAQQIINYLDQLNNQRDSLIRHNDLLKDEIQLQKQQIERPASADGGKRMFRRLSQEKHIREAQIHNVTPVQSASPVINEHEQELQQLRESVALLTNQCAQLDQANHAWQQYQQSQLDNFRDKIQDYLPINENLSLEQTAQQIVDQITKERQDFTEQYRTLERSNDDLRSESAINLETIKESYLNTINELNQELLAMKEKNEQINELRSSNLLTQTFDEVPITSSGSDDQEEIRQLRENLVSLTTQLDETNRAWQQYQQTQLDILRNQLENYLSIDYNGSFDDIAQQIVEQVTKEREDFSGKYQALEKANNDLRSESSDNMESIRQSYMNTVNELNQELLAMKEAYDQLDTEKQVLMDELEKRPIEVDQEQTRQTIEKVPSSIWKQPFEEVPIHTSGVDVEQEVEELQQLRESVALLTTQCAQLDEANRAWQQYQQTQLNNFQTKLHDYLPLDENTSFDEVAQQIVDHLTKEREDFSEKYQALERANNDLPSDDNMESIRESYMNTVNELNQELLAMKEAYDQLDAEKQVLMNELEKRPVEVDQEQTRQTIEKIPSSIWKQPFNEVPIHTSGVDVEQDAEELRQLRENVALLTIQCAQLDEANCAWQQFQQTQLSNFQTKLHDYLPIDENTSFDEVAQQIVDHLTKEREDFSEKYQALEKANNDLPSDDNMESIRESYMNTVNELNQELLAMKEAYEQLDAEKQVLISELEKRPVEVDQEQTRQTIEKIPSSIWKQPFKEVPIHTSGIDVEKNAEELRQLRENVALLTTQCAQLDEANRAWQQYQQSQLDNFITKLQDYLPVDKNTSFDEIAEQVADQITKEREEFTERYAEIEKVNADLRSESTIHIQSNEEFSTGNIDELNQELLNLKNQYEELEKLNKHLLSEKENLNNQLNDRSIVVGHHSAFESNIVEGETPKESQQESELQPSSIPNETDEIRQIRSDLASITSQFADLTQTNENELNSFRNKIQNWTSLSPNSTLDEIAQQLNTQFEQQQQNIPQTTENQTQTIEPSEKIHIAIETIPLTYESHQTQIDPIDMIDQQIQTESFQQFWSTSDDENLFNSNEDDDRLRDYIDEITALSSIDLSNRLNKDCQQILTKQNFEKNSYPNLELNHLALITIYSLYNQHLADDAKHLYNEHVIRALKEEYEAISTEKNDYMDKYVNEMDIIEKKYNKLRNEYDDLLEQNELERLHSKQSLKDLNDKYEFNLYNLHQDNEKLKYNLKNFEDNYQNMKEFNYQQLENEYQQLKNDYDELINQNELLKDYNSQIYQQKLQNNDIQEQGSERLSNANQPILIDSYVQTEFENEQKTEENDWNVQISSLEIPSDEQNLSSIIKQTVDNETQTEEQSQDKLTQVNYKLKRALQAIKDKIHQAVIEQPQLFADISDDTIDRLDHLISTIANQAIQIDVLQNERDHAQHEINQLQSSLETCQYQIDNERGIKTEQLVSAAPVSDDISQSIIEDYEKQIKQLQQKLSQNEDERTLLRQRLNEVELEFTKIIDDRSSTSAMYEEELQSLVQERNALVEQQVLQSAESQREIEQLQQELNQLKQSLASQSVDTFSNGEIQSLKDEIEQKSEELKDLSEKYRVLSSQFDSNVSFQSEFDRQTKEIDPRLNDYENQIENLTRERANLLEEIRKNASSSVPISDNDQQTDKLVKINNKLKRVLQTFKEKIHRIATERPDLFTNVGEETIERLDHLISTVEHQATQIDILQVERDQSEKELRNEIRELQGSVEAYRYQVENERPIRTEQLVSTAPVSDDISQDNEKQIKQLQQKLSQNEDERTLLRQRLNEVELEFTKLIDNRPLTSAMYEEQFQSLVQERNALVEQQVLQSTESQREIEQLQSESAQLKQTPFTLNADIKSLQEIIQQQAEELKDLSEKYFVLASQIEEQDESDQQKKETQERINTYENQIEHLIREHTNLLEQVEKKVSSPVQTTDNESQTDDQQHDKLVQVNHKLKRALQILKDKIHRIVNERPDLFLNIGEETSERLDHLISTVEHQATQIDILQTERDQSEEQLRNEIQELQNSLEACQHELTNERPIKTEQLVSAAPVSDDISQDDEKQIKQLQQKLSQNEDERSLLRQRLNEVELEFTKLIDDRSSTSAMYEEQFQSLVQERNALVEQQVLQSAESQREIEQLQEELNELKQSLASQPVDTSSNGEIQSLKDEIEQKSEELKDLSEKYRVLSSQFDSNVNFQSEFDRARKEIDPRLNDYENQIENLTRERANLLEEIRKNASSSVPISDNDQQTDKLVKINNKLKRVLQTFKEKIHRIATERPDLFTNVGEETIERLDHLISTVEHQATQIDILQVERDQSEKELRNEIRELQGSVEAYRYQIENERPIRSEQLVSTAPSSDNISQDYEKQIRQLQQKLSQNEDERTLLRQRLNEVELEFRKTLDDHSSILSKYEEELQSAVQERNAIVEKQVLQTEESQHEIEQLQSELAQLKQSEKDIKPLKEIIEQQSQQLRLLNDKYNAVSSQLESQSELDQQIKKTEERLNDYKNQIENLTHERANLLEEIRKNASSSVPIPDNDQQTDKLVKMNYKLKRALQTLKEKIHRIVTERPDLFINIGDETNERLDHLISTAEHQATQIDILQAEHDRSEEQLRNEINELQNSFDLYRKSSPPALVHKIETDTTEYKEEIQPSETSNDNQWHDWSTDSSQITDKKVQHSPDQQESSVANRLFGFFKNVTSPWSEETPTNDWNDQHSPLQFPSEEPQQNISSPISMDNLIQIIKNKIQQIISEYPDLFPNSNEDILNNLDQFISVIKNLQNQLKSLSIAEKDQKHIETQTDNELLTSSEQRISRRVFEQEMIAWSKESEQSKQFVKQIQIENKKLKDIIFKFERITRDYMHENERLKQENQQYSVLFYSLNTENSTTSDTDICYLTLKWLTYEVAQRTSDNNEQSLLITDDNEPYLKQRLIDTERQLKSIRIQNQKLKKQVETYTIQFKHIHHEINVKNQELSTLKIEIDRLRTSENQYRLEVDRLKADLQCDEVKFQHLERELTDLKFERTNIDNSSTNNLRELLELKERELNALKEKLDYTIQAHQLELQEAIKANQFSLDNVQRFEQLDQRHQEKRKELERRLGKICKIIRPLVDNQYLFNEDSLIDIDELQQLITDTEAEERVINSLGPIRDCLGLLENQMKELQNNLIENHARRSKKSKYRLGFESSSRENQFESITTDFIENDVRLCLDDILDEVIVRTTVK